MKIYVLPTLDGTVEAAVARLEALDRRYTLDHITEELGDAYSNAEEVHSFIGPAGAQKAREDQKRAKAYLDLVEQSVVNVETALETLVAS